MSRQFLTNLDLSKNQLENPVFQNLAGHPTNPVRGQFYYNTTDDTLYYCIVGGGSPTWTSAKAGTGGPPTGTAGGDLTGTYPNPTIGTGKVTTNHVLDGSLVSGDFAPAYKDGAAATPMLRSLGDASGQAADGTWTLADIGSLNPATGPIPMGGQRLTGVADGSSATDAATKGQLDSVSAGLDPKGSVKVVEISSVFGGGIPSGGVTIDSVAVGAGDRVLLTAQSTAANNGIWVVGTPWTRPPDLDTWAEVPGAFTFVEQGTLRADTGWVSTGDAGGTIGTTAMPWTQFSGAGQVIAGTGMTKSGNTLDVIAGDSSLQVAADNIIVNTGVIASRSYVDGQIATTVPSGRTLFGTAPIRVDGGASGTLNADRTLSITSFAGSAAGAVPSSAGGITTFLRADGTWAAPAGTGTVNKSSTLVGGATSQVIGHGLGTTDVQVTVYRNSAPFDEVECDVEHTSTSQVTLRFAVAPASNAYRVVVVG